GPAHQRLDLTRLCGLVVEHPFFGVGGARLHRGFRGLVDACGHDVRRLSKRCALVGAAGFEPATWSTQNSRATRLRHTPEPRAALRYTLRLGPASCLLSSAPEDRMHHAITRRDPKFLCGAGDHFEHGPHRPARGDWALGLRLRVRRDPPDAVVGEDKNNVERNGGVLHPETHLLLADEVEQ